MLVVEFLPTVAADLQTRARRSVWVALLAGLLLVAAAVAAVRAQDKLAAEEQELLRTRHLAALG